MFKLSGGDPLDDSSDEDEEEEHELEEEGHQEMEEHDELALRPAAAEQLTNLGAVEEGTMMVH